MDGVVERLDCRLCGARLLEPVLALNPSPIADAYRRPPAPPETRLFPLELALCRRCSHLQLRHTVSPEILFRDYTFVTSSSLGLVEHLRRQADAVIERVRPAPGALVVEIGSNDGSLLRAYRDNGLSTLGIDPARETARRATEQGLETWPEFFTGELGRRIRAERGAAAIVSANNVFAHSDELADMADGIQAMLADDGLFVFEVSYLPDIIDGMLFDTVYHEHVCYHALVPLTGFFLRHGLDLIDVDRVGTKGGSIRGYAQKEGGPRKPSQELVRLAESENRMGIEKPETYRAFGERILQAKQAVHDALRPFRPDEVAGYGASVTVTTLIHHFELGSKLSFLVDDNPIKQGTVSPGAGLPVLPSEELYERRPRCVAVLAWKFAEPISRRHQRFVKDGGRLLVPLPQPAFATA